MTFVVMAFSCQGSIVKEPSISVTRVAWSPDGNLLGMVDGDCSPKKRFKDIVVISSRHEV